MLLTNNIKQTNSIKNLIMMLKIEKIINDVKRFRI